MRAMTLKQVMQTDRMKEIAASFGIANGYLRDIRDRIKTFDGAAVYGRKLFYRISTENQVKTTG